MGKASSHEYVLAVNFLRGAHALDELRHVRYLRLHKLAGSKKDFYAVRLHGAWRIELLPIDEQSIQLSEVSYHYGD